MLRFVDVLNPRTSTAAQVLNPLATAAHPLNPLAARKVILIYGSPGILPSVSKETTPSLVTPFFNPQTLLREG